MPLGCTIRCRMFFWLTWASSPGSGSTTARPFVLRERRRDQEEDQEKERDVRHRRGGDLVADLLTFCCSEPPCPSGLWLSVKSTGLLCSSGSLIRPCVRRRGVLRRVPAKLPARLHPCSRRPRRPASGCLPSSTISILPSFSRSHARLMIFCAPYSMSDDQLIDPRDEEVVRDVHRHRDHQVRLPS